MKKGDLSLFEESPLVGTDSFMPPFPAHALRHHSRHSGLTSFVQDDVNGAGACRQTPQVALNDLLSATLASAENDQLIHLWAVSQDKPPRTLRGNESEIYAVSSSADGRLLASCGKNVTRRLWQVQRVGSHGYSFTLPPEDTPVAPARDGRYLLTLDETRGIARHWRLPDGQLVHSNSWNVGKSLGCEGVRLFPRNQLAIGVSTNGIVHLWDLETVSHQKSILLGGPAFQPICISLDQRWLLGSPKSDA
jgi:WD40 repeat protein